MWRLRIHNCWRTLLLNKENLFFFFEQRKLVQLHHKCTYAHIWPHKKSIKACNASMLILSQPPIHGQILWIKILINPRSNMLLSMGLHCISLIIRLDHAFMIYLRCQCREKKRAEGRKTRGAARNFYFIIQRSYILASF